MSRFHSYLNSSTQLLDQYKGDQPFALFLKKFFAADKKYGSKDRKQISHLCYCYFRLGKAISSLPIEEQILSGLFLCTAGPNEMLAALRPEWNVKTTASVTGKKVILGLQRLEIFPWKDELSEGIDHEKFNNSFLIQPDLFLRARPGSKEIVIQKLQEAGIDLKIIKDDCIALSNASKIDTAVDLNKEIVVQDYNSQQVAKFLVSLNPGSADKVWDCCAASGGKSIMLYDLYPYIDLTVSDIRESILVNLKKRFAEAGIRNYKSVVADLAHSSFTFHSSPFDLIIADVPCTGSGTWSRTPEQLFYFNENKIAEYAALQKKIISNVIPQLKKSGHLLYITCSVFKKENEENVEFIKNQYNLELVKMELLKGYDKKADTMFAALLRRPL
ncbi:MAG TPA: RsmB/NOP family class I SAM-dependent RNA methyltransferase [Chitinophagaceae bacterium]